MLLFKKVFVVAGNHDIGFHYATTPYLIKRFNEAFNISKTGVQRVSLKNIQFVLVNSMAMHGDQCSFCSKATKQLEKISQEFNCMENKEFQSLCAFCPAHFQKNGDSINYVSFFLLRHKVNTV